MQRSSDVLTARVASASAEAPTKRHHRRIHCTLAPRGTPSRKAREQRSASAQDRSSRRQPHLKFGPGANASRTSAPQLERAPEPERSAKVAASHGGARRTRARRRARGRAFGGGAQERRLRAPARPGVGTASWSSRRRREAEGGIGATRGRGEDVRRQARRASSAIRPSTRRVSPEGARRRRGGFGGRRSEASVPAEPLRPACRRDVERWCGPEHRRGRPRAAMPTFCRPPGAVRAPRDAAVPPGEIGKEAPSSRFGRGRCAQSAARAARSVRGGRVRVSSASGRRRASSGARPSFGRLVDALRHGVDPARGGRSRALQPSVDDAAPTVMTPTSRFTEAASDGARGLRERHATRGARRRRPARRAARRRRHGERASFAKPSSRAATPVVEGSLREAWAVAIHRPQPRASRQRRPHARPCEVPTVAGPCRLRGAQRLESRAEPPAAGRALQRRAREGADEPGRRAIAPSNPHVADR